MLAGITTAKTPGRHLDLLGECVDADLQKIILEHQSSGSVSAHGWCTREIVRSFLGRARAGLVLLSSTPAYLESLPTKLFEYMAAGIPVIASDFPRWREIIDAHQCGILADPTDPSAIAAAIDWIYENPTEASAMGARGRQAIESELNWESEAETMKSVYAGLLS